MDTNITAYSVWIGPSGDQLTDASRVTLMNSSHSSSPYDSVVVFHPVDDSDEGSYQCRITVVSATNGSVLPAVITSVARYLHPIG